jgi:small subunit ribosomal protein S7
MSRRHKSIKRVILPDLKYQDNMVGKFINIIMKQGKKSIAEKIIYKSFAIIKTSLKDDPLKIFKLALDKIRPMVELRSRRVGGANYQVPVEVTEERGLVLAFRWIKNAAKKRNEKQMHIRIANEIMDAFQERGEAVKKKETTHKMAEANKAFAHYLW